MASMAACECGAKERTVEHVITSYVPIYRYPNEARGLFDVDKNLAVLNISGHLVNHPALVHLPQTMKN